MKNCVVFNDLSGYGNCSLMAAIPVLTAMGVRVHPVPTAVLTRQTGYDRYSMEDLTGFMPQFTADWQEVQPDGIITGFLSNPAQGDCIADFLAVHRTADTLLVVDPVMADDGSLYDGFDEARCNAVRRLAAQADVLTPNVNELALLCGAEYTEDPAAVRQMAPAWQRITGWWRSPAIGRERRSTPWCLQAGTAQTWQRPCAPVPLAAPAICLFLYSPAACFVAGRRHRQPNRRWIFSATPSPLPTVQTPGTA